MESSLRRRWSESSKSFFLPMEIHSRYSSACEALFSALSLIALEPFLLRIPDWVSTVDTSGCIPQGLACGLRKRSNYIPFSPDESLSAIASTRLEEIAKANNRDTSQKEWGCRYDWWRCDLRRCGLWRCGLWRCAVYYCFCTREISSILAISNFPCYESRLKWRWWYGRCCRSTW